MTGVSIRELDHGDTDAVIDLIWELNLFENGLVGDRALDRGSAVTCYRVNQRRLRDDGGMQFVACRAGLVIGYACCVFEEGSAYLREDVRRHAWLAELIVAADARGTGAGRALVEACEDFVRGQGIALMRIGALAANQSANAFYQGLGYEPYMIERAKRLDRT